MWGAYTVLTIAHIFNNDLGKQVYQQPSRIDTNRLPYRLCYVAIVMYEWNLIASLTIMFGYTCLEYPFSRKDGSWDARGWYFDLLGHLVHYAPIIVSLWEFNISSIRIELYRLPVYMILMSFYMLINISEGETQNKVWYSSMEWTRLTKLSTVMAVV